MAKTKVYTRDEIIKLDDQVQEAWAEMTDVINEVNEALLKYQLDRDAVYMDFVQAAEETRDVEM